MRYIFSNYTASGVALGGIGAGSVEVRADGLLHDWLIFNNGVWTTLREYRSFYPLNERSFLLAVRAAPEGGSPVVRMLQSAGYMLGADPYRTPWLKPVEAIEYVGEPPMARLKYIDADLPMEAEAEFLSPFIPGDLKNSALPAAIIRIRLRNKSDRPLKAAVMAGLKSPFKRATAKGVGGVMALAGFSEPPESPLYDGSMALALSGGDISFAVVKAPGYEEYGASHYNEELVRVWVDFRREGRLRGSSAAEGEGLWAFVASSLELGPGEEKAIYLVLAWYFPNHYDQFGERLGHYYENFFSSAVDVAKYVLANLDYLYGETAKFHDAVYGLEGMESWVADLVASQLTSLLKLTWLTKDGRFAIWEGLYDRQYSGPELNAFNTTDVVFYIFPTLLSLFPELAVKYLVQHAAHSLARGTPEWALYALAIPENYAEMQKELAKDPGLALDWPKFVERLVAVVERTGKDPAGRVAHFFNESIKGVDQWHMVDLMPKYVLMAYSAAKWAGNLELLRNLWPAMTGAVNSVVKSQSFDGLPYHTTPAGIEWENAVRAQFRWRQPALSVALTSQRALPMGYQTFDTWAFYGVSSYVLFLWIAALEAMVEASARLGEAAGRYEELLRKAQAFSEKLWNGEYFILWADPATGERDTACMAAQMLGQLAARVAGLRPVADPEKIKSALRAVARYNLARDEGLINGVYPGSNRPSLVGPMRYENFTKGPYLPTWQMDTPWSGVEFAIAGLMLYEGLVDEALAVLREVHKRYARGGHYWSHVEWGAHYMRPLSSWLVVMGALGISYDGWAKELSLKPAKTPMKWAYAVEGAWGIFAADASSASLNHLHGELEIAALRLWARPRDVKLNGKGVEARVEERGGEYVVRLASPIRLRPGDKLDIAF